MRTILLLALTTLSALPAAAQSDTTRRTVPDSIRARSLGAVKVTGRIDDLSGVASSASEGRVGASDFRLRPLMREGELLETVPGMIVTQHSGDGKANQLFVRGFNLDHGTDFQTRLDGMPVNNPSHAHGQGYTDLNFLIPELVEHIDYRLGVHHASLGDFGSAGGAEFHLARSLDRPFISLEGGRWGYSRLAAGASRDVGPGTLLIGGEGKAYDGPWSVDQRLRKASGLVRYSWGAPTSRFSVLGLGYNNRWNASDQLPLRAVESGSVSRFGQIDPSLGGESDRYSLSGSWNRLGGTSTQVVQVYGIRSTLDLYSNFTYLLDDATDGDQFNQRERRSVIGANAQHKQQGRLFGREATLTLGLQHRTDVVDDIGLHRTRDRQRLSTVRQDDVTQSGTGLFGEAEVRWAPKLRTVVGLRGDAYQFRVTGDPVNSGRTTDAIASPKASLIFTPSSRVELYLSGGLGFHSNDARGTTITVDPNSGDQATRVDPLVRSRGVELGLRATPVTGLRSTVTVWALELASELVFVGDGGTTEPSDRSRRSGITFANFYRPIAPLSFDADVSLARARFVGVGADANRIPGALENVIAAGATWGGLGRGPFASLRLRHFGAYPLIEDNSVRATGTTLMNGEVGIELPRMRLQLSVLNLLNARARDIQYYYASRLAGEPAGGIEDVHFHPVEPRQVRLGVRF
ncbi:MAG: TonB-dependent receptor [Gemmatimonadaceae bacterium]|nr:TonB-dependent receptor [Gemmatimonadaceae bacterium]